MSAGFDCNAPFKSRVEAEICRDGKLSRLDDRMTMLYRRAIEASKDRDSLRNEQLSWLQRDRDSCNDRNCLYRKYEERNSRLVAIIESTGQRDIGKYIGHYKVHHTPACMDHERGWRECEQPAYDALSITANHDGTFEITAMVTGNNFHQCDAGGTATRIGDTLVIRDEPGSAGQCVLVLVLDPDGIMLVDKNDHNCYCGMNVGLDGHKFRLADKVRAEDGPQQ